MINKKSFRDFDFGIFGVTFLLLVIGLLAVYSTTYLEGHQIFIRQIIWIVIGILMGSLFYFIPLKFWNGFSWFFYLISIIALVVVLFGKGSHGVRRWFELGAIRFQPSEIAKLGTLFFLASFLSNKRFQIMRLRNLTLPLLIIALPFILVLVEPDAGTSLIFLFSGILLLFYKGTPLIYLFIVISPAIALICGAHWISLLVFLIVIGAVFYFARLPLNDFIPAFLVNLVVGVLHPILWGHLKPYQRARIASFLFPSQDPQGMGWQIMQSKIAIGSGGLFGKGIFRGTQKGFDFLPEVHTDFVFSAIGEEFGFLGCLVLLACFFMLLWKGTKAVVTSRSDFNSFLGIGIVGVLGFQIFINVGMATGIIPVIGAPLPFISYGGSSMMVSLIMIGLLLNIAKHRYKY
ncbi:rod shape-determining protein RodA [candidate division WOR-3 bacterium]|nr:rod shape-determining protein RodA [candidate division WOR-3 bacterium]